VEADVSADNAKSLVATYHLFGFLWTVGFIKAVGWLTIAGAIGNWFFSKMGDDGKSDLPEEEQKGLDKTFPIAKSLKRTLRYHLGTAAFGSLIIAIIQFIRVILEYIDAQTKEIQEGNLMIRLAMKCVKCCMWCFEKSIKFVSGFAFVYTAAFGQNFCSACKSTFYLFLKNTATVVLLGTVEIVLSMIACIAIPMLCAIICYCWIELNGGSNAAFPCGLAMLCAYFVCKSMAASFECGMQTLGVCALKDKEEYGGKFMSAGLASALGVDQSGSTTELTSLKADEE